MTRKLSLISLLFAGVLISQISAYSKGAPKSENICKGLTPKHPGAPQESAAPYTLSVDKTDVKGGEQVTLTIASKGSDTFKGFLVQGRKINHDEDTTPVGKFAPAGNSQDRQHLDCNYAGSSITHTNNEEKSNIELTWVAPEQKGSYVLLTTIVKDGVTYWIRIPSPTINVA